MKNYQDMKDRKKVKAINHSKLEYKMSPSDSYQSVNLNRYKYVAEVRRGKYVLVFTLSVLFLLLSIPADQAYGETGTSDGSIQPNTPIKFLVEVIDIEE